MSSAETAVNSTLKFAASCHFQRLAAVESYPLIMEMVWSDSDLHFSSTLPNSRR